MPESTASCDAEEVETCTTACLVLVCGLPGCGKTSLCETLVGKSCSSALLDASEWHHVCYDKLERELREASSQGSVEFDPMTWKAARERAKEEVRHRLKSTSGSKIVLLLDDNMYFRSMRKQWYHFAADNHLSFRQVFLNAPADICMARNSERPPESFVPTFSIQHMAERFEWPFEQGNSWEARPQVSITINSTAATVEEQASSLLAALSAQSLWVPVVREENDVPAAQVQSSAHHCDVALRRVVTRALAAIPANLGQEKAALAKSWSTRKAAMSKKLGMESKALDIEGMINDIESAFLRLCVEDVQNLLS